MEWMILLLVAIGLIVWLAVRSAGWKTVLAGTGGTADDLQAKYAFLKSHNVKCRLRTEAAPGMGIAQQNAVGGGGNSSYKLDVHKNDLERSKQLLHEFDRTSPMY